MRGREREIGEGTVRASEGHRKGPERGGERKGEREEREREHLFVDSHFVYMDNLG